MKVVINTCYGGFSLSDAAIMLFAELSGVKIHKVSGNLLFSEFKTSDGEHYYPEYERNDPKLIQVVEQLGKGANGSCASLDIIEIPDEPGLRWHIEEYDGSEYVAEDHRTWN